MNSEVATPSISLKALNVRFGEESVLSDVNLTIQRNSCTCLIGVSASGKTVLAKTVAGLIKPSTGQVLIDDQDLHVGTNTRRRCAYDRLGFVFQRSGLLDSLPIWTNVAFRQIQRKQWNRTDAEKYAKQLLRRVGLTPDVAHLYPTDLSGGMQKRVGVARAIAGDPDILILDDPTAGLDPISSRAICNLILNMRRKRPMTVLAISSDMDVAQQLSDSITLLHAGKCLWSGPGQNAAHCGHAAVEQMIARSRSGPLSLIT